MEVFKEFGLKNKVLRIIREETPENPRNWDNLGTMVCWHRRYHLGDQHNYDSSTDFWEDLALQVGVEFEESEGLTDDQKEEVLKNIIILPLYLYDHSGITMNTSGFACGWDSGQVGYIYATRDEFRKETGYSENELFSTDKHRIPNIKEHVKIKGYEDRGYAKIISINSNNLIVDWDYNKIPQARKPENVMTFSFEDVAEVMSNRAVEMLKNEVKIYDQYLRGDIYGYQIYHLETCEHCNHTEEFLEDSCWGFYGTNWEDNGMFDYIDQQWHHLLLLDAH